VYSNSNGVGHATQLSALKCMFISLSGLAHDTAAPKPMFMLLLFVAHGVFDENDIPNDILAYTILLCPTDYSV
jgi:hypothetical protein